MSVETRNLRTYVTQVGFNEELQDKQLSRSTDLTEIGIGSGLLDDASSPAAQTGLITQIKRYPINALTIDPQNPGVLIAEAVIPADEGGWTINEATVYTSTGTCYAYARQPGDYKPSLAQGQGQDYLVRLHFIPTNADQFTLMVDPTIVLATHDFVDDQIKTRVEDKRGAVDGFGSLDNNARQPVAELPVGMGRKNYIINGNFDIWQRGSSFVAVSNDYTSDRWSPFSGLDNTVTRSTDAPDGSTYSYQTTRAAGVGYAVTSVELPVAGKPGDFVSGKEFTLSLKAKSTVAEDLSVTIRFSDSPNSSVNTVPIVTNSVVGQMDANGFADLAITFTVSDVPAASNTNLAILIFAGSGSDFKIAQVQLEEGGAATPFEFRPIAEEMSLCRWYFESISYDVDEVVSVGQATSATNTRSEFSYSEKREPPAITIKSGAIQALNTAGTVGSGSASFSRIGTKYARVDVTGASGLTAGDASSVSATVAAIVHVDAEL